MHEEKGAKYLVNVQKRLISQWEKFSEGARIVINCNKTILIAL